MTHTDAIDTVDACHPSGVAPPKWAAVVGDRLFPMPRRRLKARDILAQAGVPERTLVRDYNQPLDLAIPSNTDVDLAAGNVFRILEDCDNIADEIPAGASPKLAFVADDAWEVTVQPVQTVENLRGLFDVPDDAEILRDFESPDDEVLAPGTKIRFEDGPVFRIRIKSITVKVNNQPVHFAKRRVTGLEVKQTAIAQGVAIDLGCVLYRLKPGGGLGPAIADHDHIALKQCDEFRCVAPDDNS